MTAVDHATSGPVPFEMRADAIAQLISDDLALDWDVIIARARRSHAQVRTLPGGLMSVGAVPAVLLTGFAGTQRYVPVIDPRAGEALMVMSAFAGALAVSVSGILHARRLSRSEYGRGELLSYRVASTFDGARSLIAEISRDGIAAVTAPRAPVRIAFGTAGEELNVIRGRYAELGRQIQRLNETIAPRAPGAAST